jgi:acetyltransferase-like isoleucine patch superfamily enzyme
VTVGDFCFIGVNATIGEHITIGERCIIGMHAAVLTDAAPGGVYAAEETTRRTVLSDRVKL